MLDFVATLGKRGFGDIERLRHPDDVARWARHVGLADDVSNVDDSDLAAARLLREALYGLVLGVLRRAPIRAEDVTVVNEWARREPPVPALTLREGILGRGGPAPSATAVLAAVARDGIDLLAGADAPLVRECEGPTCTLLFVDTSRGRRRRWCSMDSCGARAKMATMRASRRGSA